MPTPLELAIEHTSIPELGKMFFPEWRPERHPCHCPDRPDKRPSFNVYSDGKRFHDFASGEDGNVVGFLARIKGIPRDAAARELIRLNRIRRGGNPVPPAPPQPAAPERPRQKRKLPPLDEGTRAEHLELARLRNLCPEAIEIAIKRGTLRFYNSWEGRSWVLTDDDRQTALARRLDGELWERVPSHPKAYALTSIYWPIGWKDAVTAQAYRHCRGWPRLPRRIAFCDFEQLRKRTRHNLPRLRRQ